MQTEDEEMKMKMKMEKLLRKVITKKDLLSSPSDDL